jgi:excinuclease UvrABC ATPase subunit
MMRIARENPGWGYSGGGRIVAQGMPDAIVRKPNKSHAARILGEFLAERSLAW